MTETRRKERGSQGHSDDSSHAADAVMKELEMAQRDYDDARFVGFTEEELIKYAELSGENKRKYKEDSGIIFLRPININIFIFC